MPASKRTETLDGKRLLMPFFAWLLAALLLLTLGSFAVSRFAVSTGTIGVVSSAISFLAGAAAGAKTPKGRAGSFLSGLLFALLLSALLIGLGACVGTEGMDRDAVLSAVSFTVSGVLFGALFADMRAQRGKGKKEFSPRRGKMKKRR